jgi:diguanylate cyclase (GGDEF)-like protein
MAAQVAERVRSSVEGHCSSLADERIKRSVTVSVGVATFGEDATTAETLVEVADARMYDAKRLGKNRVLVGDVPASHGTTES